LKAADTGSSSSSSSGSSRKYVGVAFVGIVIEIQVGGREGSKKQVKRGSGKNRQPGDAVEGANFDSPPFVFFNKKVEMNGTLLLL